MLWCDLELDSEKKEQDQGEKNEKLFCGGADAAAQSSNIKSEGFDSTVLLCVIDNETAPSSAAFGHNLMICIEFLWKLFGWEPWRQSDGYDGEQDPH